MPGSPLSLRDGLLDGADIVGDLAFDVHDLVARLHASPIGGAADQRADDDQAADRALTSIWIPMPPNWFSTLVLNWPISSGLM